MIKIRAWYIRIFPQRYSKNRTIEEVRSLVKDTDLGKVIQIKTRNKRVEVLLKTPEMDSFNADREIIRGVFKDHFEHENYALISAIRAAERSDV